MKTDNEVIQTRDHVEMIKRPHLWPYPVLCLKWRARPTDWPQKFGRLEPLPNGRYRLHVINDVVVISAVVEYDSAETIVSEGWEVD